MSARGRALQPMHRSAGQYEKCISGLGFLDAAVAASVNILVTVNVTNIEAVTIQEPARRIGRGFHAEPGPK